MNRIVYTEIGYSDTGVLMKFDRELDARGLSCPMPVLRTKQALATMEPGEILQIMATDPASVVDIDGFAFHNGHELLESTEVNGEFHFVVKKASLK